MKASFITLLALAVAFPAFPAAQSGSGKPAVQAVIDSYRPGTTGFGRIRVDSIDADARRKRVTVFCNDAVSYIPLTQERVARLKAEVAEALGIPSAKVDVRTAGRSLDELARFASKAPRAPREKGVFVADMQAQPAPKGLDGANIALWQSHGWYFEPKLNRWE